MSQVAYSNSISIQERRWAQRRTLWACCSILGAHWHHLLSQSVDKVLHFSCLVLVCLFFCAEWSTRIWPLQLKISWKAIPRRETKSFWNNSVIVSLSNFPWKLNLVKPVVCGNLTDSPTREVSLEDWLRSNNGTGAEGNQGKRKKRQTGSTMITEEYRAGFRLTYTCGIARQFKNSTELYNERWRVLCI